MKNTFLIMGLAGLTTALLSFTFVPKSDEIQEPKKTRHIRMTKIENGKKMEIDTVLTGDDVFVWNGDTINPVKHIRKFNPSGFDKIHGIEHHGGKEKVMIIKHKGGKAGEPISLHLDSGEDIQVFSDADSLRKRIIVRRGMKGGEEDHLIEMVGPHKMPFPPIPPVPNFEMLKMHHSGRVIDLNDPNIISYKKKNMGGDREKIEIVRKKSGNPENMAFDLELDHEITTPEGIEHLGKLERDHQKKKVAEKQIKVDEEKNKETKEETEGNK